MRNRKRQWTLAAFVSLAAANAGAGERGEDAEEDARRAALRAARAEAILAREEGRGRPFDPAYRADMKARLGESSPDELDAVDKRGYGLLPEPEALGDSAADLVYTPVSPCRIVDTRLGGGPLAAGFQRDFYVAGDTGFTSQGGNPAGCGVPRGPATAAVVNFVAVNPAGPGNLRAWAYGGSTPNASIINYAAVGMNIANAVVVPLCDARVASCGPADITVQADVSGLNLVADVVGYFRSVVKAQYRTFTVADSQAGNVALTACGNPRGTRVTVGAPVAGRIVVEGSVAIFINHVVGVRDSVFATINTAATDCSPAGQFYDLAQIPPQAPSSTAWRWTLHPRRVVVDVLPGVYSYYLNLALNSGADAEYSHSMLTATFHPE